MITLVAITPKQSKVNTGSDMMGTFVVANDSTEREDMTWLHDDLASTVSTIGFKGYLQAFIR
jgi:hypothetical protein